MRDKMKTTTIIACSVLGVLLAVYVWLHRVLRKGDILEGRNIFNKIRVEKPCDLKLFQRRLDLDSRPPILPIHLLSGCQTVLNNRVPKTASRTTVGVFDQMAKDHNFIHIKSVGNKTGWNLDNDNIKHLVNKFEESKYKFIMSEHLYYHDFRANLDSALYINAVRDPISWFESIYASEKYVSNSEINETAVKTELRNCVLSDSCWVRYARSPIHFFCGGGSLCDSYSKSSLERALKHFHEYYLIVGLTERLHEYFEVLEYLLPHLFHGSKQFFALKGDHWLSHTKTKQKIGLSEECKKLLKSKMALDCELYNEVRQKFDKILAAIRWLKENTSKDQVDNKIE